MRAGSGDSRTNGSLAVSLVALLLALVACDGGMGMMGDGLGGDAESELLAEAEMTSVPDGPLVWRGFVVSDVEHEHGPAFVHAREATTVTVTGAERRLDDGDAVFVPAGATHIHGAGESWDVVLTAPDHDAPAGASAEVFRSDVLEGIPGDGVLLRAILVELPPGTQTSVHTHPGPEFIYVTRGPFMYESGVTGEQRTAEGDSHTLPPDTPVQKRKPDGEQAAAFLSWFVVDPSEPFTTGSSFDE